ncbi:MAG: polymerase subunit epsilon, partial [Baekduia sp.]|nr:polymerase subunit epsilon [Baekduia sp.]
MHVTASASAAASILDAPLATTEFLVIDTETNGLGGDRCEVTEIGAVLVGGGELHERWETLVQVRAPLSRGIHRFTGISQAMVDEAPPADVTLPELAEQMDGRVLVAHNAAFDRRVLAQAFARAGVPWPDPPTLCTVALARALHPLARQRKLRPLAESLGIDVDVSHRALA